MFSQPEISRAYLENWWRSLWIFPKYRFVTIERIDPREAWVLKWHREHLISKRVNLAKCVTAIMVESKYFFTNKMEAFNYFQSRNKNPILTTREDIYIFHPLYKHLTWVIVDEIVS